MASESIFNISNESEFKEQTLNTYRFQYRNNLVYREFCTHLGRDDVNVKELKEIPFLPISFFKSKEVISSTRPTEVTFTSSGTTGSLTSKHHVVNLDLYEQSFLRCFELFYGNIQEYCVLALLPSYLEREGSSLIYMAQRLIEDSKHSSSGFYLNNLDKLKQTLLEQEKKGQKTLLIGVSFALLDLVEEGPLQLKHTLVMETGGMKGRRKELIREELHDILSSGLGVEHINSEYGMTELLSQAYSTGQGLFTTPPWMKIMIRDTDDPLSYRHMGKTGGINVIDLANKYSCSFIATQDLGKLHPNGCFEILGRFDHSDIRGCNLMVL